MTRLVSLACLVLASCASGPPQPAELDTRHEQCRNCRMVVSSVRTAAQIVAPGELPMFFDDLGCLRDYRASHPLPDGAVVYVGDYRTGEWIREEAAIVAKTDIRTPMGSGLVARLREEPQ